MTPDVETRNRVPLLFGLTSLLADMTYELAHVLLPILMMDLGGSAAMTAIMESTAEGARLGGFLTSGRVAQTPRRESMAVRLGYGLTVFSTALMGTAGAPVVLILLKGLSWFGKGLRGPARDALLANSVPKELHGRAFGTVRALDQIGGLLGPLMALALWPFLSPFRIVGLSVIPALFCILAAILATRTALLHQGSRQNPSGPETPFSTRVLRNLRRPEVLRYMTGGMLLRAGTFPATLLMFRFVSGSGPFSDTIGGFLLASLLIVLTNMAVVRGILPEETKGLFSIALIVLPLSSLLLSAPSPPPVLYLFGMGLWGIGEASSTLATKLTGIALWAPELRTQGFALFEAAGALLSLVLWPLLAHLWDTGHTEIGMGIAAGVALTGGLLLRKIKNSGGS